jgi:DNA-binding response OmpR family regulator
VLARGRQQDIVTALEAGADDCIVKPINTPVLMAKLDALYRRREPFVTPGWSECYGVYAFHNLSTAVRVHGQTISLRPKEFALARMLFRNLNKSVSRTYLLEAIWGTPQQQTRTLDAHISSIRRRLQLRPANGFQLVTLYGIGYRLEDNTQ